MKHTDIRAAVLDALEQHEHGATLFDGRPVVFDEEDFPAIAVYLTDAEYTGEELDADTWRATLHIEVFLPAQVPDSELDQWMESRISAPYSAALSCRTGFGSILPPDNIRPALWRLIFWCSVRIR